MIDVNKCLERGCPVIEPLVAAGVSEATINSSAQEASAGMETYCAVAKDGCPGTCGTEPRSQHVLRALAIGIQLGQIMEAQAAQPVRLESTAV